MHLRKKFTVSCPHQACNKKYDQLSSFTGHLSKKNRTKPSNQPAVEPTTETDSVSDDLIFEPNNCDSDETLFEDVTDCSQESEEEIIMRGFAQFCMKLEFHFLIPETIQSQSKQLFQCELMKTLTSENICIDKSNRIVKHAFLKDPFEKQYAQHWKTPHKRKTFYKEKFAFENPLCIKIVIHQDGVEIVNAIGSAKQIHKLLAIHLSILNLSDYLRSHINSIKLVALCKEKHFDHQIVYGRLVQDLKVLEERGLKLPDGRFIKAITWVVTVLVDL
ncbi:Energy-coupling factor transporter ATP-binding protein EcfA1 [Frankliniella fusca]|uniref:Energy-coupling factor transporter ATP-binding protein EcfA1 n=1 Tax=Frankliniella fusca TaxID=407009 RepID=A0AAE1GYL4_9NEOP|nr:Energy-coupling factor transporter ATP-binding protein EcfA1 [Frankliniella fusca]